jgi:hypothetical protein
MFILICQLRCGSGFEIPVEELSTYEGDIKDFIILKSSQYPVMMT